MTTFVGNLILEISIMMCSCISVEVFVLAAIMIANELIGGYQIMPIKEGLTIHNMLVAASSSVAVLACV